MGPAITFKEWLEADEAYKAAVEEATENEVDYIEARKYYWRMRLICACAVFFPDLPEIEGWILVGVRGL